MKQSEIQDYIKAGEIAREAGKFALEIIKPTVLLLDIADLIEKKIQELGGQPAFPVNLSINEISAHYTPSSDDKTIAFGLLKVDLGVSVNGFIADTAFSIDLTDNKEYKKMIEINQQALNSALKILKPGAEIREIGDAIQDAIKDSGFSAIKNLSGHSLDKNQIHGGITLSNYTNNNTNTLKNIAVAIEPFLTSGDGYIYEGRMSEIFMLQNFKKPRDSDARKILAFVQENYSTRPFCKRWLRKAGFNKIDFLLKILTNQGILHNFPILIEKGKKPVSQAEHTALILEDKVIITTKDN